MLLQKKNQINNKIKNTLKKPTKSMQFIYLIGDTKLEANVYCF